MSKVADNHKAHGHQTKPHHGGAHKPNHGHKPNQGGHQGGHNGGGGQITNFNQQAMDQQMMVFQMQQAQLIQRLNAQIAGLQAQLQGPQLTPQQQAAQAQAEQQAAAQQAAQQAAFAAYETQALAQFQATSAAMQQQFAGAMQGFGSMETSLGGFLNQSFAPAQYNGGVVSLTASSALFSGPIAVPNFYGGRRY